MVDPDTFPRDVLQNSKPCSPPAGPNQRVRAVPGAGARRSRLYILGSSTFGGQLAAALGLPHAFAAHFAPAQMRESMAAYRQTFRPSEQSSKPHMMVCLNVTAAETDAEARYLLSRL